MPKTPDPFAVTRPVRKPEPTPEQLKAIELQLFLDEERRAEYDEYRRAELRAEDEENARA